MEITELLKEVLDGIKKSLDVSSVIGAPIKTNSNTTVVPISKMTFGFASGGGEAESKNQIRKKDYPIGGMGGGATVTPVGFLVMTDNLVKFLKIEGDKIDTCIENIMDLFSR